MNRNEPTRIYIGDELVLLARRVNAMLLEYGDFPVPIINPIGQWDYNAHADWILEQLAHFVRQRYIKAHSYVLWPLYIDKLKPILHVPLLVQIASMDDDDLIEAMDSYYLD